jgi:hypothetical protein
VASEHRPVLASRFAPAALSSSGAAVSEAQPETNQATAIRVIVSLMGSSPQPDRRSITQRSHFLPAESQADCRILQLHYT